MKNIITLIFAILLFSNIAIAQVVPSGMNYQAVARDLDGKVMPNKDISLKVGLVTTGDKERFEYIEEHSTVTNQLGLFTLVLGEGKIIKGSFKDIPWSTDQIWLELSIDVNGGKDFTLIHNSRLLAVPYAIHALTASELTGQIDAKPEGNLGSQDNQNNSGNQENQNNSGGQGNVWKVGGNIFNVPGPWLFGTLEDDDLVMITNNIIRLTIDGVTGKVNIVGDLSVGVDLTVGNDASIGNDLDVGNDAEIGNDLSVVNDVSLNTNGTGSTINNGDFTVANQSATDLTGTLNVDGTTDLNGSLDVNNNSPTKLTGTLNVNGVTNLNGIAYANSFFNAGSQVNLNTSGGATTIFGTTTVNDITNLNGQVTIKAPLSGVDTDYSKYPLRVEGGNQGVAIKLNAGTPNNANNFITFFNNSGGAVGRIEGETFAEKTSDPQWIFDEAMLVATEVKAGVNVGLSFIPVTTGGLIVNTGPCGACIGMAAADLALATANLIAFNVFSSQNLGVTYQSGSADYAEWLERGNPAEKILAGEIVGINGGKISKNTTNAQQYKVISTKPAMLGNMPMDGTEELYEKVAFMGQIPVKIRGIVFSGDYIIPSGLHDGIGIAVSPDKIKPEQYREIVGVAWSSAFVAGGITMVNMAIGLNANDVSRLSVQQEKKIKKLETELETKFNSLEQRILALENGTTYTPGEIPSNVPSLEVETVTETETEKEMTREEWLTLVMPPELSDEVMEDAIHSLEIQYRDLGVSYEDHPGLKMLFTDASFKAEVIKKSQETYRVSYQSMLEVAKK